MNTKETREKVDKLYRRITSIAEGGKRNAMEYIRLIDELVANRDLDLLKTCMITRFDIDLSKNNSISEIKSETWPLVLRQTNTPLVERIRTLYKSRQVYQQGDEIRSNLMNTFVYELSDTLSTTYSIVATPSKIGVTFKDSGIVSLDIIDPKIRTLSIYSVNWATTSTAPTNKFKKGELQRINAGTYYETLSYTGSTANSTINNLTITTNSVYVGDETLPGIDQIDVELDIKHTYVGDMEINLKSPNDNVINVLTAAIPGGFFNNFANVRFTTSEKFDYLRYIYGDDTKGTYQMHKLGGIGTQSYISNVSSVRSLAPQFNIKGTWSLYIRDLSQGDDGVLRNWKLNLGSLKPNTYLTQSSYDTQIPSTSGGVYRIEVETFNPFNKFNYRLSLTKDDILGTITEVDIKNYLDLDYYYIDKKFRDLLGIARTFLEVRKAGTTEVKTMMGIDPQLSEDSNLYNRYVQAIDYLLS